MSNDPAAEEARIRERLQAKIERRRSGENRDGPIRGGPPPPRGQPYHRGGGRHYDRGGGRRGGGGPSHHYRGGRDGDHYRRDRGRYNDHNRRPRSRSRSPDSSSEEEQKVEEQDPLTKGQRTILVSQLVMKANERNIKKYLKSKGIPVNEVSLLRDKRGTHKGIAYVELRRLEDVPKAVALHNQPPDFQKFPILIKESEAEKNFTNTTGTINLTALQMGIKVEMGPLTGSNGRTIEAQKVYVGNLETTVTAQQLFCLFTQFGQLQKVTLQTDSTNASKGFAFLSFRDPREACLAIQTMSGQNIGGKPMKTGWASQVAPSASIDIVTSDEFPSDAASRTQKAYHVLAQLTMGTSVDSIMEKVKEEIAANKSAPDNKASIDAPNERADSTVAVVTTEKVDAPASSTTPAEQVPAETKPAPIEDPKPAPAASVPVPTRSEPEEEGDPSKIANSDHPTVHLLVRNMYDKDTETEDGWEEDLRLEFVEECEKFGTLKKVQVMSKEPGGKIFASFDAIESAHRCASTLAGRFFDGRQLRVAFVTEKDLPY